MLALAMTLIGLGAAGSFLWARHTALGYRQETGAPPPPGGRRAHAGHGLHSLPVYHGAYAASWALLPSMALVLVWLATQNGLVTWLLLYSLPESLTEGRSAGELDLLISQIRQAAAGQFFGTPSEALAAAGARLARWQSIAGAAMAASAAGLTALGSIIALRQITPEFRARNSFEHVLTGLMIASASLAVLTTLGIVVALLYEAQLFFDRVDFFDFLFGVNWEPQIAIREDQVAAEGAFGAIPVFTGTLLIALIAMAIAVPIGLMSSIYLAEYAGHRVRAFVKPALEILSGVPTVVYGFFAVLVVAPALVNGGESLSAFLESWVHPSLGFSVAPNSAIAAGSVMGIMIIPFVSSLSDDALNAVPNSLRDGSYALGATQGETISRVLLPAALPGIAGGVLLALSRAIGETMIVVMAAGLIARLTANPFEGVTTVTVQIVTLLVGDTEFDNAKTLAAFALGLVLFVVTLGLNVVALHIVQRYRERYE